MQLFAKQSWANVHRRTAYGHPWPTLHKHIPVPIRVLAEHGCSNVAKGRTPESDLSPPVSLCGHSSTAEPQAVNLEDIGSIPIVHPN